MSGRSVNCVTARERGLGVHLGNAKDLFGRGDAGARLGPAVVAQRHHAALEGVAADLARRPFGEDEAGASSVITKSSQMPMRPR